MEPVEQLGERAVEQARVPAHAAVPAPVPGAEQPPSAVRIARQVAGGEVSAEEVVLGHLQRIAEIDPQVHALLEVGADAALARARRLDRRRARGDALGPLAGVPVVIKDNIDVRGQTTSSGSRAHDGVVALRDAPVVARLRAAGAVLLARANMDELAMGASTHTSAFGPTRNPHDLRRSPGGSSGGSAAAVAADMAALSVGTDTGGSIREPAAQCGVVGMAPSPGLVPLRGVVPFAPDLDRAGPVARDAADAAHLLAVLSGRRDLAAEALNPRLVPRLRVGVVTELGGVSNQPGVLMRFAVALETLRELGVEVVPVSVPDSARGLSAYMRITSAACVPLLAPYIETGQAGPELVRRWELGRDLLRRGSIELADAYETQWRLLDQTRDALTRCDVLVSPTMPTTAPLLFDETADRHDVSAIELADPMRAPYTDCWTVVANLAHLPSLSLPAGLSPGDGMPVGVMLTGRAGGDTDLLGLAAALESRGVADR